MAKFTIITNTIRRPLDLVMKSVKSSLAQDSSLDVVLVDQNEIPLVFPGEIKSNPQFKQLIQKVPAVSMARNRAVYGSDCEWIIFCDDDGYLVDGYYQKLLKVIEQNPGADIFAGSIKRIDNGDFYSKRHALGGEMNHFWNSKLLMGSNFVIKRAVFEELGKFDEKFGAGAEYGSSEETDLAWNAFFHHKKMQYVPELVVFHVPPFATDAGNEIKKAFRYGVGKGKLVRKWLFLGHFSVLYELMEMILLPILKAPFNLLILRWNGFLIQLATLGGRLTGFIWA